MLQSNNVQIIHPKLTAVMCFFFFSCPQLLFQYPVSQSQPAPFYVGGPMGGIDSMAGTEPSQQAPPPAPMTPAPPPSTSSCSAGPSPSSQGSETSFDCTHCGKSLRSRKNYSKHMFIHSGKTQLSVLQLFSSVIYDYYACSSNYNRFYVMMNHWITLWKRSLAVLNPQTNYLSILTL